MFSLFPARFLYFPCYVEVSLDSNILNKNVFFRKKSQIIFKAQCVAQMYFYLMFKSFQYTILCYSSVSSIKKRKQKQKEKVKKKKKILKLHDFFFILCWKDIYLRLIIYQTGITMNLSNKQPVAVLSNLQFNLIFSVLKESCKNEYICPSDIVTSSRICLIIFSIKNYFVSSE